MFQTVAPGRKGTMKHPCRQCHVFIAHGINTGPLCEGCNTKEAYISAIGAAGTALPDDIMLQFTKGAKMKKDALKIVEKPIVKTCTSCGFTGDPELFFGRHAMTKDGYAHICKTCHGDKIKNAHQAKAADDQFDRMEWKDEAPEAVNTYPTWFKPLPSYKPDLSDNPLAGAMFAMFVSLHIWAVIILIALYYWR